MIISRIGSLVIEPTIKLAIKWKDGTRYVRAEKLDPKIQILLQDLNTYRTITAMGLLAVLAIIVKQTAQTPLGLTSFWIAISASTFITILFAISYYKQTKYITNRINSVLRKDK
jgi:hypothetical protein